MSFQKQIRQHYGEMMRFAVSLTNCEHQSKDLVQESSIKAFSHYDKLHDKEKFKSWFSTILYNTFVNDYRKRSRRRELLGKVSPNHHFFNATTIKNRGFENLKAQDIQKLSKSLGSSSHGTFKMYMKGYSYNEISDELGIPVGTVKSRLNSIRTRMKYLTRKCKIAS